MAELSLKIPASSANLGLGFDSIGVAVNKFLYIEANLSDTFKVSFKDFALSVLPSDETNLVFTTARNIAGKYGKELPALHIEMQSEIPLSHGLGSSSSAIVAGIEIADHFLGLNLSDHDKVLLGCEIEGHPDNIGPCITGGAFVGYYQDGELFYYHLDLDNIGLIISVPEYEINTEEARDVLPNAYTRSEAVAQNALANVMILALHNKDYGLMGELMMKDSFHEPYRQPLIKEFDDIKKSALDAGALATVISGAGPTVLTLAEEDALDTVLQKLQSVEDVHHEIVSVYTKEGV
ncbi:Homoserine kinase [Jeotgalicoccus saudimassiliensis]|uniref:Homoserine kinase n=1 Tax=Jeotgalicoccus saudimassiliensis TaxID=1461582 RepID=A0A078M3M0_9STAP|nr:homoserine kinase [Jeotgalicoccus saudimassiliensis]CDZ99882.1 Homoserine kinase [Jeotgalicoccus saudimassiliensis]